MAYRRYRSYRYRGRGYTAPSKYTVLQSLFGSAVAEIQDQFFKLDPEAIDELLTDYGSIHGKSAETYARNTMPKWKSGFTRLSGQTMERLIELVPPYLSPAQRHEILRQIIVLHKRDPETQTIKINVKEPAAGLDEVNLALQKIKVLDELAFLPPRVMEAAKWLYDDDVTAARIVMVAIAAEQTNALKKSAEREIGLLTRTLQSGQIKAASYTVKTPGGNLNIVAYTPSKCFVATACFGSGDARTETFREWRDTILLNNALGRRFIVWYYNHGDYLSERLGRYRVSLAATRFILTVIEPVVRIAITARSRSMRDDE